MSKNKRHQLHIPAENLLNFQFNKDGDFGLTINFSTALTGRGPVIDKLISLIAQIANLEPDAQNQIAQIIAKG